MSVAGAQPDYSYSYDGSYDSAAAARCPASRFDIRCQLEAGHATSRHVAFVRHPSSHRRGYSVWTQDGWSAWEVEVGPQPWAASFPRSA